MKRSEAGSRYRFRIAGRSATFRLKLVNLLNDAGWGIAGSGICTSNPDRHARAYLAIDF